MSIGYYSLLRNFGGAARIVKFLIRFGQKLKKSTTWCVEQEGQKLTEFKPDLWHLHSSANWLEVIQHLLELKAKTVFTLHDPLLLAGGCPHCFLCTHWQDFCKDCPHKIHLAAQRQQRQLDLIQQLSPLLVSPSHWLKKISQKLIPNLPIKVIYNGVETIQLKPNFSPLRYQQKTILFIAHGGVIARLKGGDFLLKTWPQIKRAHPETRGFILGGDKTQHLDKDLIALPYLPPPKVLELMSKVSLLIYPTSWDNFPLVILEAMSAGLPVLSFDLGGIKEQIVDGKTGFLIKPGKNKEFLEKAIYLLSKPLTLRKVGIQARNVAEQNFNWQDMAQKYFKLYSTFEQ